MPEAGIKIFLKKKKKKKNQHQDDQNKNLFEKEKQKLDISEIIIQHIKKELFNFPQTKNILTYKK